jgi:hypothetical protein
MARYYPRLGRVQGAPQHIWRMRTPASLTRGACPLRAPEGQQLEAL